MKRLSPTVERALAAGLLGCAFVLMASVFGPQGSMADNGWADVRPGSGYHETGSPATTSNREGPSSMSTDPHEGMALIGELLGATYRIEIYANDAGPVYSIYNAEGSLLGALLTREKVEHLVDDGVLSGLVADAISGEAIMRVDDGGDHRDLFFDGGGR